MIVRTSGKRAWPRSLLHWYSLHQRDLPWRKTRDPYRIMVSEFMLQQTRVETVLPYYDRFLKVFPSLPDLARAPLQKVLKSWSGLGYYARARNLHGAARKIVKRLDGRIPSTKSELLALPGFGPYTAGAVASIAFNESVSALDGNVKRVLTRLSGLHWPVTTPAQKRTLEEIQEKSIPPGEASNFNQALMDLGALICLPLRPKCFSCPVKRSCLFPSTGSRKKEREGGQRKQRKENWLIALVERKGRFLIHQKKGKGLLAGLWQFPTAVIPEKAQPSRKENGKTERELLKNILQNDFGVKIKFRKNLPFLQHSFTHIQATMKPYLFSMVDADAGSKGYALRWVKLSNLSTYPFSRAMGKVANLLSALDSGGMMKEEGKNRQRS